MLVLAITYALIGAVLGLRFRVMVLMPAIAISGLVIVGVELARGTGLSLAAVEMVVAVASIQIGYLGGAAIRLFLAAARGAAARRASTSAAPHSVS